MKNKILDILRTDARASNAEIARRLGAAEEEVARQIRALEDGKIVLGYRAVINPEKLDDEPCLGIIEVKITPQRNVGYDEIAAQIYKFPEVKLCYLISGAYDVLVFIEGRNLKDVATFVSRKLATIDNVTSTATHFILKKYKEAGIVIGEEDQPERLPVVP
ncbi:MAG: Lrp/AsnC family transcriptional regulator [bacterium]|nr:Lrp/AsnC family transcriptional regulator [bacterium]